METTPTNRITFFTRPDCTLCRAALYVVERVRATFPCELDILDISATGNERWSDLYKNDIPIVHLNGGEIFRHHVDEVRLRDLLSSAPPLLEVVSSDAERPRRLPPGQVMLSIDKKTGRRKWPVLQSGQVLHIDPTTWSLRFFGLVERPIVFDWQQFNALPRHRVRCDIHCVTRWSRLDNTFEGVLVRTILRQVSIRGTATHVMIHAAGPDRSHWTTNLPLDRFADEDCLFATHHDGAPLSPEHGGPARLVVPKLYFWKSAKWVTGVEFMDHDRPGFWERGGYHMLGDPWQEQRYA